MSSFFQTDQNKTTFDHITRRTYDEFYKEFSESLKSNLTPGVNPVKLAIQERALHTLVFKPALSDEAIYLKKKYHTRERYRSSRGANSLYHSRVLNTNKINSSLTIEDALPVILSIKKELGSDFFGALLQEEGKGTAGTFNPLNPLVAVTIKNTLNESKESPEISNEILYKKFAIIVYSLKEGSYSKDMQKHVDGENYRKDIGKLMISPNISRGLLEKYSEARRITESADRLHYSVTIVDQNGNPAGEPSTFIVPIQIANNGGLMYPSYGAALFNRSSAMNMTPYHSANIGEAGGTGETWSNVCAGSLNSGTDAGKATLNHSNNGSPLNSSNIGIGAIPWAQTCADMSLELLLDLNNEEDVPELTKRMTFVEFKERNPGKEISDFMDYIKELNASELPEW